ncbi:hypothetical protein KY345_01160 [Candidatus Woesearchaeota archaeon]|nr:hypothetical protein [Candidatus Woesearchaeota archaeon]
MELEKGDPGHLLGKLWVYSARSKTAFYFTDQPATVVSEVGGVLGIDAAIQAMPQVKMFEKETAGGLSISYTHIELNKDSRSLILESGTDVIDLDNSEGLSLERKLNENFRRYFAVYSRQIFEDEEEPEMLEECEYDTEEFMKNLFFCYRRALETSSRNDIRENEKRLKEYSRGKRFEKDVKDMLSIGRKKMELGERLEAIGLYASLIDFYMNERYTEAAGIMKQIKNWREKNSIA